MPNDIPYRVKDLTGRRFGRLHVLRYVGQNIYHKARWECLCDCGQIIITVGNSLIHGHSKSCGCLNREKKTKRNTTHGMSKRREYSIWCDIKKRCLNRNSSSFSYYGGRGITMCIQWQQSFESFYKDMGPMPTPQHTIERLDNNGPYNPKNCTWESRKTQARNTRRNRYFTYQGKTLSLAEWAEESGMKYWTLHARLRRGWTFSRTISEPLLRIRAR